MFPDTHDVGFVQIEPAKISLIGVSIINGRIKLWLTFTKPLWLSRVTESQSHVLMDGPMDKHAITSVDRVPAYDRKLLASSSRWFGGRYCKQWHLANNEMVQKASELRRRRSYRRWQEMGANGRVLQRYAIVQQYYRWRSTGKRGANRLTPFASLLPDCRWTPKWCYSVQFPFICRSTTVSWWEQIVQQIIKNELQTCDE